MATILLGVTGGIAAYKACEVLRLLDKAGQTVRVVMTRSAADFVGPLTFETLSRAPVLTDDRPLGAKGSILHIEYADAADLFLIAPCTANVLAKLAKGVADDALSTTALAFRGPLLIAPAMNVNMWRNEAVRENVEALRRRGASFVDPTAGDLACGWVGDGRLAEPQDIVDAVFAALRGVKDMLGLRVLVSAGPTVEPIDPVRFLSNRSSGRMGYAIAAEAQRRGATVRLVSGPVVLEAPEGVDVVRVETAAAMKVAIEDAAPSSDVVVMSAAVADYRVAEASPTKIKKDEASLALRLVRNDDILASLGARKPPGQVLVGFAAETSNADEFAAQKLKKKNADLFVANDVSRADIGFGSEHNEVTLVFRDGRRVAVARDEKRRIAGRILDAALSLRGAGGRG